MNSLENLPADDGRGTLWGGSLAEKAGGDPDDPHSLSNDAVVAMHVDETGVLWIATFGGLNRLVLSEAEGSDHASEQFSHFRTKDGLPTDAILSVLEEDRLDGEGVVLWLGTGNGLSRFDSLTETSKNYDASDGLQGNEFVMRLCFKTRDGELFFGGLNGFSAFYPAEIQDNPHVPPIVITDLQLANKPVEIGGDSVLQESIVETEELVLSHEDRVISFEFAALNYSSPEKNRYRYKWRALTRNGPRSAATAVSSPTPTWTPASTSFACWAPTTTASGTRRGRRSTSSSRHPGGRHGGSGDLLSWRWWDWSRVALYGSGPAPAGGSANWKRWWLREPTNLARG